MAIEKIKNALPAYARDMRLNVSTVLTENGAPGLEERQIAAIALASAMATNSKELIGYIEEFAQDLLTEEEFTGAQIANSIMSMNNIYYRFLHLVSNKEYGNLPARLRMNQMANPGLDKATFELASIAVSAINGCGMCIDSHEKALRELGVSSQGIQSAIRIAAVLFSVATAIK